MPAIGSDVELGEALSRHYASHGLPMDGGASASWFRVRLGPLVIPVPNPPARRRAVFFHDANHVLTGYDTTFSRGEVLIAAFEVGAGCGGYLIAWMINLPMMVIGGLLRPREIFRAFVRGRHATSIYRWPEARGTLERMQVADLRERLLLHRPSPAASRGDLAAFVFWYGFAALGILLVLALLAVPAWWAIR